MEKRKGEDGRRRRRVAMFPANNGTKRGTMVRNERGARIVVLRRAGQKLGRRFLKFRVRSGERGSARRRGCKESRGDLEDCLL